MATEFDRRALRLLNLICLYGGVLIIPVVFIKKLIDEQYIVMLILLLAETMFFIVIYLNSIGKNQIACLIFFFSTNTLCSVAVALDTEQLEVPFIALSIGVYSIFLLKNKTWRIISFTYSFVTFAILHHIQMTQREFGIVGYILTLVVLLIFSIGLRFVNTMRNKNEKTILVQNETLKNQNEIIKTKSQQLLQLEKEKYQQELLLKQKDMEMVLANNKVRTQLNDNIINKLKLAQKEGDLEKNINKVIVELLHQNEINTRMKLIEENLNVVNTGFLDKLLEAHPNMTRVDKELCSYIKMGLSSKEISIIRNTTVNSVNVTKTRLRKKINLASDMTVSDYLKSL
ncbi:helix-turn-helix transcriptional regulator [Kordia sp.]|uniref:helix-turn-helix transcriptional regulator n=1 Tax=Kordia sp. TaxID=1965332 RepID=UPI003D6A7391